MPLPSLPISPVSPRGPVSLGDTDAAGPGADAVRPLAESLERIGEAHRKLRANGHAGLLLVFEGPDASGKDSTIRRLVRHMDPMAVQVHGFGPPTAEEARHDFLWRAWHRFPARGEIAVFNRSHYEAVLAERMLAEGSSRAADGQDWASRFRILRALEAHLGDAGFCVLKFWMHVSARKQVHRLRRRLETDVRQWKFEEADLDSLARRDLLLELASEMIGETHTAGAPWHIVPADSRKTARRIVAARVAEVLELLAPGYPPADPALRTRYAGLLEEQLDQEGRP